MEHLYRQPCTFLPQQDHVGNRGEHPRVPVLQLVELGLQPWRESEKEEGEREIRTHTPPPLFLLAPWLYSATTNGLSPPTGWLGARYTRWLTN